jgi:hypothetical protein
MNFKSLLFKLTEARTSKEAFTKSGEAEKKERAKGSSTDLKSKDAARKRIERSRMVPRDKKPKQELVKEVISVKTNEGKLQLIFKDSFNEKYHTRVGKDGLSLGEAQQLTRDPNFEQTRASKLLFGEVKTKEPKKKENKKEKTEERKSESSKGTAKPKEAEEQKPKARRLSKEEIFQNLSQMNGEQLAQLPPELRQEYFMAQRKPLDNNNFDNLTYESLSIKFSLNPISSSPFNQQVLNALIFLAKMKMGASDQEMQTLTSLNPAGLDFTRNAFYTAKKILSQLGEACIQNMLTSLESGPTAINSDGMSDMSCGNYRFKVSAGGEISLSTSEMSQSAKSFKGYIGAALAGALSNPDFIKNDKMLGEIFQNGAEIKAGFSKELIPDEYLDLILKNEKLTNKFMSTPVIDMNGNNLGMVLSKDGKLNPKVSLNNYQEEWKDLSKGMIKGKNSQFKSFIIGQVLKNVLRGDGIVSPKVAANHVITINGVFPLTDDYINVIANQSELDLKPAKNIITAQNVINYKPSAAEMLKKYSVIVEQNENNVLKKMIVPIDSVDAVQLMVSNLINNYEISMNASLLPGFKPKDLNAVEYNHIKIGKKMIKIPVEKGQKIANSLMENTAVIMNEILLESLSNNFVLNSLVKVNLIDAAEESFIKMGNQVLLENEVRPQELKFIYQNLLEKIEQEPFRYFMLINLLNSIEEEYKRDYDMEYRNYHGKPKQRKERAARTKAREQMEKKGVVKKGDGKDIDHKKPLRSGGSKGINNLRVRDRSKNRADNGHKKGEKQNKDWK